MRFPIHLILIGVGLGYFARVVYPPKTEIVAPRVLLLQEDPETFTDLPIIK